ncbi:FUSC family protein [Corynebacterium bovis]|uniref:FUSC family protein n=1 Tax=Corynebacterium bovis TaxID=36808 RepID=UPI00244B5083|nr:FUSC family protein [Corynebacterium bovis]MDH2456411.1 FUSC family protein [Corynebacterium bovis]
MSEYRDREKAARERPRLRASEGVRAAAASLRRIAPVQGWHRVREAWVFAVQCAIAAGLALWFATDVMGHQRAFFAPIAAVISLGVSGGTRLRRGFELVLGAAVGIGIGDVVVSVIGSGYWQVAVVVLVAILLAVFVDKGAMVPTQAAGSAVLVATLIPPGTAGNLSRMVDALIGGVIGLIVMAVVPSSPLRAARREVSSLISKAALVLDDVAEGIEDRDATLIREALETARGTQTGVNALLSEASGGQEIVSLSPIYWTARRHSKSMTRILAPVDNVMRNSRVLARRAELMIDDREEVDERMPRLIRDLSDALGHLGALYAQGGSRGSRRQLVEIPDITRRLQFIAGRAGLWVAGDSGLSGHVVLAQCRSIIVDALQICGLSRESAVAALRPTVERPKRPPEVWEDGEAGDGGDGPGGA